ncbi:MAG: cytochrome c3 family protein [Sulfuricurvum sp.]|uniref:cytochrome c3 family protein n=1 Tax=Sulfuricurvum sp. TaxID=2025608 RepID=UPI002606CE93|nr:cytochrome c3 family protein [Sulfuricurvum sp.]MDD5118076.1 cytochrome c3 family protein [Sulfuricurvum sp.]
MRKSIAIISSVVTATLLMVGCGGGGSGGSTTTSSVSTATFIDSYVAGLEFDTSTESNVTDNNGNFRFTDGESVTFHIGNLYLGSAKPKDGKVTPLDLVGTTDSSDPKVVRMLRTLQTLDSDGDPTNGITIDPSVTATLKGQTRIDMSTASDADVLSMIGKNDFAVSSSAAQGNFTPSAPTNASKGYNPTQPTTPTTDIGNTGKYTLVAWNDLGMHCMDGNDYSIFSILPPYNNLHAHLISKDATSGKNITSGVTLTYEAVADPTGSINTTSVTKTNFWDWVLAIFGGRPADNHGLNLSDPAISNPTPSATPSALNYNSANGWWEAEGIPVTPYDDKGVKNYYPMVKVVAKDASGTVIATTKVVLPVSDEMSCAKCHASNSSAAAKPSNGWVNNANLEKDWKQNILKLHDDKFPNAIATANMAASYTKATLLATANAGQPVLCAACHKSNALGTSLKTGIKPLTEALHSKHATVTDPATGQTMNNSTNRDSCYTCHPGSATSCLRGAMGKAKKADGTNAMDCQSCHGKMTDVGRTGREGWLDQPNCQQCHDRTSSTANFTRFTSVFSSGSTVRSIVDTKFATNPNTPMSGKSLYRFSKGHGNLQCEACHGATHAIYPSSHVNDNVQSIALQGHTGTISECTTCHTTVPTGTSNFAKGPHGMHVVGQSAVSAHKNAAESNRASCTACHGSDYRGSILSATSQARTLSVEHGTKTFAAKHQVSCYDCHNGPNP